MDFFVRLKDLRTHYKLTQAKLAEIMGIDQSVLSRIETQGKTLNHQQYSRLAEYFGDIDVIPFLGKDPHVFNLMERWAKQTQKDGASSEIIALIRVISKQQEEIDELRRELEREREKQRKEDSIPKIP